MNHRPGRWAPPPCRARRRSCRCDQSSGCCQALFFDGGQATGDIALGRLRVGEIAGLVPFDHRLIAVEHGHEVFQTFGERQRAASSNFSPPVISDVSPNNSVVFSGYSLSNAFADGRVGAAAGRGVRFAAFGRDPELADRAFNAVQFAAFCRNFFAAADAANRLHGRRGLRCRKPTTGLPVVAMPSTTFASSRPQCRSPRRPQRSGCSRCRSACGNAARSAPIAGGRRVRDRHGVLMLWATASAAAFDRSSTGRDDDVVTHADATVFATVAPEF